MIAVVVQPDRGPGKILAAVVIAGFRGNGIMAVTRIGVIRRQDFLAHGRIVGGIGIIMTTDAVFHPSIGMVLPQAGAKAMGEGGVCGHVVFRTAVAAHAGYGIK